MGKGGGGGGEGWGKGVKPCYNECSYIGCSLLPSIYQSIDGMAVEMKGSPRTLNQLTKKKVNTHEHFALFTILTYQQGQV